MVDVAVRLPKHGARAGATFEVFVMVYVAEGWHVNAHEPTLKYLIGTTLDVAPREDLRVQAAYYPDPLFRTFAFADDTLAVYEGEIAIILAIRAAEALSPGTHTVVWDGRDEAGAAAATGVYVYRLQAGAFVQSRTLVLLR